MGLYLSLNSPLWRFMENYVYRLPEPPPRKRTKPMEVIAVGLPRSATESLQNALITLGYDHTFHGWDIIFEEPLRCQGWVRLLRKKYHSETGDCQISAAEFDELLGHSVAVTDAPAACFAAEMIEAYPNAKVIINQRKDVDAWHRSAIKNLLHQGYDLRSAWILSLFNSEIWWMIHANASYFWKNLFRCTDNDPHSGIERLGKWVYREHVNSVRGLLYSRNEMHRLLEWAPEDGWEPLCKFLDKPVPKEKFPRTNDAKGFEGRVQAVLQRRAKSALIKMAMFSSALIGLAGVGIWKSGLLKR